LGKENNIPCFLGCEEGEKQSESVWLSFLGALDERQTMSKINARTQKVMSVRMFAWVTANVVEDFDMFLGGSRKNGLLIPGALSSRFSTRLEVPRPDPDTMHKILMREINKWEWNPRWADAAMEVAKEFQEDDPRAILAYLDGGDRLLDGTFLEDKKMAAQQTFINKEKYGYRIEEEKEADDILRRASLYSVWRD
jgi:hypothetical protein